MSYDLLYAARRMTCEWFVNAGIVETTIRTQRNCIRGRSIKRLSRIDASLNGETLSAIFVGIEIDLLLPVR